MSNFYSINNEKFQKIKKNKSLLTMGKNNFFRVKWSFIVSNFFNFNLWSNIGKFSNTILSCKRYSYTGLFIIFALMNQVNGKLFFQYSHFLHFSRIRMIYLEILQKIRTNKSLIFIMTRKLIFTKQNKYVIFDHFKLINVYCLYSKHFRISQTNFSKVYIDIWKY